MIRHEINDILIDFWGPKGSVPAHVSLTLKDYPKCIVIWTAEDCYQTAYKLMSVANMLKSEIEK